MEQLQIRGDRAERHGGGAGDKLFGADGCFSLFFPCFSGDVTGSDQQDEHDDDQQGVACGGEIEVISILLIHDFSCKN